MSIVKRFVLIYHGYEEPTRHLMTARITWLQHRAASFADFGHPFGPGREITNDTTNEFSLTSNPASGFSIVNAPNIDAAEQLLEGCPIIDSVTLYEALPAITNRSRPRIATQNNNERRHP